MDDMFVVKKALDALEQAELALQDGAAELAGIWMVLSDKWLHIYEHVGLPDEDEEEAAVDQEDEDEDEEDQDFDEDDDVDLPAANLNGSYDVEILELAEEDPDDIVRLGP